MNKSADVLWRQGELSNFPLDDEPAWPGQPFAIPVPNAKLREASSVEALDAFFAIGEAWAQMVSCFLPPEPAVLDIGCGCGKLARFLYLNPKLRYVGVDLFLPGIEWCRRAFAELAADRFRFEHFDGISPLYNPGGTIRAEEYRQPAEDATVDMVVCASLFTHLLEPECVRYLAEIHRVLKPGGRAIISIHNQPPAGASFSGDVTRIDIEEQCFLALAEKAGLRHKQTIGRVYGQQVFLLERT
jgi:SAM-dependent methyltransferase